MKTDRRLNIEPDPADDPLDEILFRDGWGDIVQRFDPRLLDMPADLQAAVAKAFRAHDVSSSTSTRITRWNILRAFGRFLRDDGHVTRAADLDGVVIRRFVRHLAASRNGRKLGLRTQYNHLNQVGLILELAARDNPGRFGRNFEVPPNLITGARSERSLAQRPIPKRLSPSDMKMVLAACYAEIDKAWERFEQGQLIVARAEIPSAEGSLAERNRWIWKLHRAGDGLLPPERDASAMGMTQAANLRMGGLRTLEYYLHLTTDTLAAFYIALLIQTAANPGPLRQIKRDCLVGHPLDEHRVLVEWTKARAGRKVKRVQRRSFDRRRPRSAPKLIEKLLAMTAPLLPHTKPQDRGSLFLHRHLMTTGRFHRDHGAGLVNQVTLWWAMRRFCERHNAEAASWNTEHPDASRPLLPDFSPKLFRSSMASAHYTASGGDILAANAVLNHADVATTDIYVDGDVVRRLERDTIARLQSLMTAWVKGGTPGGSAPSVEPGVTALFGHDCLNPMAGPVAQPGRSCAKLGGCLACPGLIVPVDPEHLARILQAKRHLELARERIDPRRFALFYAPSLRVLMQDLLPAFPVELMPHAERITHSLPPLPDLE